MPNYACCRGADRLDDLINSVKTLLICDDLKPPYKGSNSQRGRERGDGMIKVEMDSSRTLCTTSAKEHLMLMAGLIIKCCRDYFVCKKEMLSVSFFLRLNHICKQMITVQMDMWPI